MDSDLFARFPCVTTPEVTLRRIEDRDIDRLFEIYNNTNLFRYTPGTPRRSKEAVRNMIGHFQRDFDKRRMIYLGIARSAAPDELLGIIELFDYDRRVNMLTLGYRLHEGMWGKGIATMAVQAVTTHLLCDVGINRVQAYVMPENAKSRAVLERCRFQQEGIIRQGSYWTGRGVIDLALYSRLRSDMEAEAAG